MIALVITALVAIEAIGIMFVEVFFNAAASEGV